MKVLIIEKNGDLKEVSTKNKIKIDELYKKCKFRNTNYFDNRNISSYNGIFISLFAKDKGRASTENKYELPPPLDNDLYFGSILVVLHEEKDKYELEDLLDLSVEKWEKFYEKLFGGFEDLGEEDSYSSEEEIDPEMLTKDGYSKEDGFVVDSDEELEDEGEEVEEEYIPGNESEEEETEYEEDDSDYDSEDSYIASELEEEEYIETDDD